MVQANKMIVPQRFSYRSLMSLLDAMLFNNPELSSLNCFHMK